MITDRELNRQARVFKSLAGVTVAELEGLYENVQPNAQYPAQLPAGAVLVVDSARSGAQIARDRPGRTQVVPLWGRRGPAPSSLP